MTQNMLLSLCTANRPSCSTVQQYHSSYVIPQQKRGLMHQNDECWLRIVPNRVSCQAFSLKQLRGKNFRSSKVILGTINLLHNRTAEALIFNPSILALSSTRSSLDGWPEDRFWAGAKILSSNKLCHGLGNVTQAGPSPRNETDPLNIQMASNFQSEQEGHGGTTYL